MSKFLIILYIYSLSTLFLFGSEQILSYSDTSYSNHNYGLFFHIGLNIHKPLFKDLDEVFSCCPEFNQGDGLSINFGAIYEYNLNQRFSIGSRLGYYSLMGELTALENKLLNDNGLAVNGHFEHHLKTDLSYIEFEPMLNINLLNNISIHTGFLAGFLKIFSNYNHYELIIKPNTGTYENGSRTRLVNNGTLEKTTNYVFALSLAMSYKFQLNQKKTINGNIELFYNPYLTHLYETRNWKVDVLRFGIAIKYNPVEIIDNYRIIPEIITDVIVKKEVSKSIKADIFAKATDEYGNEFNAEKVKVIHNLADEFRPLLPYIFFDENSYQLNEKYQRLTSEETENFDLNKLKDSSIIGTYYHILNIIGFRMNNIADSKIIIAGANDGLNEKNIANLSENRAITIRNYLENVWNINRNRITIKAVNLPNNPSNSDHSDGNEENRRVEFIPENWTIIAPVEINDTTINITPDLIKFYPIIKSDTTIIDANIHFESSNNYNISYSNFNNKEYFQWKPNLEDFANFPSTINYEINAENQIGQTSNSEQKQLDVIYSSISKNLRNIENGKYVDRYSLVYFQFDKSRLSVVNDNIIRLIQKRLEPDSEIFVVGFTDRTGTGNYNSGLSSQRAKTVSEYFKNNIVQFYGSGIDIQTFDNNTPEGRFYSRRVEIRVETPIK